MKNLATKKRPLKFETLFEGKTDGKSVGEKIKEKCKFFNENAADRFTWKREEEEKKKRRRRETIDDVALSTKDGPRARHISHFSLVHFHPFFLP